MLCVLKTLNNGSFPYSTILNIFLLLENTGKYLLHRFYVHSIQQNSSVFVRFSFSDVRNFEFHLCLLTSGAALCNTYSWLYKFSYYMLLVNGETRDFLSLSFSFLNPKNVFNSAVCYFSFITFCIVLSHS